MHSPILELHSHELCPIIGHYPQLQVYIIN